MYGRQSNSVTNPLFCSSALQSESDKGEEDGSSTQVVWTIYEFIVTYLQTHAICIWQEASTPRPVDFDSHITVGGYEQLPQPHTCDHDQEMVCLSVV